jgi:hypothetical protein
MMRTGDSLDLIAAIGPLQTCAVRAGETKRRKCAVSGGYGWDAPWLLLVYLVLKKRQRSQ